uniref:PqqD family protein n=1 Tax=uncultured bacterium ws198A12 TaxID=1131830 RepID=I1X5J2_9BACT|nr:hypothetical protein ws198A12_0015 [uncultured bacterium ws198A12]
MAERTQPNKICRPREDLGIERIEDDLLILDKRNQKVHQLNTTASVIWANIIAGQETDGIVREIVETFDISPEVASQDVTRIVDEFCALGLLENPAEHSNH